ncbi:MAG: hypothetical protein IJK23_11340 [Clostridia bacterium]|nr:hypothetical protein [Clostridia bacterium]
MRSTLQTIADLPKESVDVVLTGTSGIHCSFIPGRAYEKFGIASYDLTVDGMQVWTVLPTIKYALKYQQPKLFVIDMRPFIASPEEELMDVRSRYFNEVFPMYSYFRMIGVNQTLRYMSRITDTSRLDMTYYFNVLRYHDMWQEDLTFNVLKKSYSYSFGYRLSVPQFSVNEMPDSVFSDKKMKLEWYADECLQEILDFAKRMDLNLLFVNSPHLIDEDTAKRMNTLHAKLKKAGIPYVDFCTEKGEQTYVFDKKTDFRDTSHTNYDGSKKFTDYFAEYLNKHYDLDDRRKDEAFDFYVDAYEQTKKRIKQLKSSK